MVAPLAGRGETPAELRRRLTRQDELIADLMGRIEALTLEKWHRSHVIAERVLGWRRHPVANNTSQRAYGPDERAVARGLGLGRELTALVDDVIAGMDTEETRERRLKG